jgi:hypothetical protein
MLISLCTRLEQRMVTGGLFCKEVYFCIKYNDNTRWETTVKLPQPIQDANELRSYIKDRVTDFEMSRKVETLFTPKTTNLTIGIQSFVSDKVMQYSLFDNRMRKDTLRKVVYQIKDFYDQKNIVRKGSELFNPYVLKDAVGFGSVRDLGAGKGKIVNKHMLEEDAEPGKPRIIKFKPIGKPVEVKPNNDEYHEYEGPDYADINDCE